MAIKSINYDICVGCGNCVKSCAPDALRMNPETKIVPGDSVVPDSALEVGISLDNQLSKGLEGNIYESDMNRPWNSLNSPSQSNYSDRQVTEKTPWENGNRPEYTPLDKQ